MGTFPVLILFTLKVLLRLRIDGLLDQKKKLRRSDFEWPVCRKNNSCVYPSIFFCMILFVHRSNLTDDIK